MRTRRWLFAAIASLALAGCGGDGGGGPTPGNLLVSYFQGGPEVGAVLLTISGGPVENVTALGGQQVSFSSPFAGTTKVVLAGNLSNGDVLRIRVPDVSTSTSYHITVEQAADQVTFALLDPGSYQFTVHR